MSTVVPVHVAQPKQSRDQVVAHTPDPTAYHMPDERALGKMRGGGGIRGVMIPRATQFGGSQGFSTKPGIVNIIDMGPDGSRYIGAVDMEKISQSAMLQAMHMAGGDPQDALALIAQTQGLNEVRIPKFSDIEPTRDNPLMPGRYVVPASTPSGKQLPQKEAAMGNDPAYSVPLSPSVKPKIPAWQVPLPVPPSQLPEPMAPGTGPQWNTQTSIPLSPFAAVSPSPPGAHPEPAAVDQTAAILQLTQMVMQMQSQLVAQQAPQPAYAPEPTPAPAPAAVEPSQAHRTIQPSDVVAAAQRRSGRTNPLMPAQPDAAAEDSFASLRLPFLQAVPTKPTQRVYFDLGPGGTFSAYYHTVIEHGLCLALVYDTRHEAGQYLPGFQPNGTIKVTVESSGKSYNVYSRDFLLPLGCLDISLLVIDAAQPQAVSDNGPPTMREVYETGSAVNMEDLQDDGETGYH